MKTKFKYFSLAIAALLMVGFASCSSDDEPKTGNENETISVVLKIASTPVSRAEVPALGADVVAFNDGHLYFTTAEGAIVRHYKLIGGSGTAGTNELLISALASGTEVEKLPGNTKHVYVFGNTPTDVTMPNSGPIGKVKGLVTSGTTQGTITNVNLYGEALTLTPGTDNKYSVSINLAPTVARIELAKIQGDEHITGFNLKGVFIDNYFSEAMINGAVDTDKLVDNGTNILNYVGGAGKYPAALSTIFYDSYDAFAATQEFPSGPKTKPAVVPTGGVWGYNLFASQSGSAVPRIIIRLSDVTNDGGIEYGGKDQFITVRGFRNQDGGALIEKITPSNIYNISNVLFCSKDISSQPNLGYIDVKVEIKPVTWKIVNVVPEL